MELPRSVQPLQVVLLISCAKTGATLQPNSSAIGRSFAKPADVFGLLKKSYLMINLPIELLGLK
jgi:hypothetical protein